MNTPSTNVHVSILPNHTNATTPPQQDPLLTPGTCLGNYTIVQSLGEGGCGVVWLAEHHVHKHQVAIKVLRSELASTSTSVRRFLREVEAIRSIGHPNIVEIHELGWLPGGRPYFIMEYLPGLTLSALVSKRGRIPVTEALDLLTPVCHAVDAAHQAGFIHRDLKPSNIMLTTDPQGKSKIKVLDFGVAKLIHPDSHHIPLTSEGDVIGTSHVMAPEQITGTQIDVRTDVYALGILLYMLLTGGFPFWGPDIEWQQLQLPPPRPSQSVPVSRAIDALVMRALEKQPEMRFSSVLDFLHALTEAVTVEKDRPTLEPPDHQALALLVELTAISDIAEDWMDTASTTLDAVEHQLVELGFGVVLRTATTVVVGLLLGNDETEAACQRAKTSQLTERIQAFLAQSLHEASITFRVKQNEGPVTVRQEAGQQILEGDVFDIGLLP